MLRSILFGTVALLAITPAIAMAQAPAPAAVEEVVVTGSRIALKGYQAPTPVTVVGTEQLHRDNYLDVPTVLTQLPAVSIQSPSTNGGGFSVSGGNFGLATANLRNLGTNRTLILYDGVRAAASTVEGDSDLDMIPTALLERIDVVTAGASAAWGSNAVAGVVNVVLNKKFTGLSLNATASINEEATSRRANIEAAYGRDVMGGRGHLILSGAFLYSPDVVVPGEVPWFKSQYLINNPAATATNGLPALIHAENVGLAVYTQGGLVTSGPLRGLQFLEGGVPGTFNFGAVSGSVSSGGTFAPGVLNGIAAPVVNPLNNGNLFGHFRYAVNDDVNVSFEMNYTRADASGSTTPYTRQNNLPISIENPFLPSSVVTRMQQAGITTFNLSTTNSNNLQQTYTQDWKDKGGLGVNWQELTRSMFRQVAAIDATVGNWKINADVQHSKVHRKTAVYSSPMIANYNLAVDAVRVSAANVGASGLQIGSIACRSTLTNPTNGCVPLNVLGINVASPAAIAYVDGPTNKADLWLEQYSADASIQGTVFTLPAGDVAVAAGLDWRRDSLDQQSNPLANALAYAVGNYPTYKAHEAVWEAFSEVEVPLLKDQVVKNLSFNGAVRYTNYAISGTSVTWKAGLQSQLTDDFRVRGTISEDIRAPSLSDLFTPTTNNLQVVSDPARGNATTNIYLIGKGNPNLRPETGHTKTVGLVFSPRFLPGFNASVDWYNIKVTDALAGPGLNYILQQCAAGVQLYCALTTRDANGVLLTVSSNQLNVAAQTAEGYDFQVDYSHDLGPGRLTASLLGNYTLMRKQDSLGTLTNSTGSLGGAPGGGGQPHLKGNMQVTYRLDRFSGTIGTRYVGSGKYSKNYLAKDIDDNSIPQYAAFDVRASYFLGEDRQYQIYGAIDNVLDKDPPIIPALPTAPNPGFGLPTRLDLYSTLGRVFRIGARAKF